MVNVMLDRPVEPDLAALCRALKARFPGLGPVSVVSEPALDGSRSGLLAVDGATVPIRHLPYPLSVSPDQQELRPVRYWDPRLALASHDAHLAISCGGERAGLDWMRAYATVSTAIAAALAERPGARGVYFATPEVFASPAQALRAAEEALTGVSPIEAWVSFYRISPSNIQTRGLHGAATLGLAAFLGREIELAPAQIEPRQALERIQTYARAALAGAISLGDWAHIGDALSGTSVIVRESPAWLRPNIPAFVLVGPESAIDPSTLTLKSKTSAQHLERLTSGRTGDPAEPPANRPRRRPGGLHARGA